VVVLLLVPGACNVEKQSADQQTTRQPEASESVGELPRAATDLMSQGDYDGAIAKLNRALELKPNDAVLYYNRANAYAAEGEHERAIKDYNAAIRLDPTLTFPYFNRGNSYRDLSRYDEAITSFGDAIRVDPLYVKAYLARASVYMTKGEFSAALADLNRAIEFGQGSELVLAYFQRAGAYRALGQKGLSESDMRKVRSLQGQKAGQ
jgi:tetratricopeptide (TPR) repeat protein